MLEERTCEPARVRYESWQWIHASEYHSFPVASILHPGLPGMGLVESNVRLSSGDIPSFQSHASYVECLSMLISFPMRVSFRLRWGGNLTPCQIPTPFLVNDL